MTRMEAADHQSDTRSALRQLRQGNVERVLEVLRTRGPQSRAEVARSTRLSRTTLSGIVGRLLADGVLVEEAELRASTTGRGRPVQLLSLNPSSAQSLGIEIGRERVKVVLADAAHEIKAVDGTHVSPRTDARSQAGTAVSLLREVAARDGVDLRAVTGAGIGTPGPGETAERIAETGSGAGDAPVVPRHRQIVTDVVSRELGVPVLADNNSRLAALGEAIWGAARGGSDVLYVALSHGVGGGLVASGRLFRGAHGAAAEVGHISVAPEGPKCWCGGHGCMELFASAPALLRSAGRRSWRRFRDALDAGEERACAALERAADSVGRALAAACTTANPERIVLGGEVAALGPVFLDAVHASFRHYAPTRVHRHVSVTPAALDDRGGALGALALALHESPLLAGYSSWLPGHVDESTTADPDGSDADDQFARAAAHPGSARDAD